MNTASNSQLADEYLANNFAKRNFWNNPENSVVILILAIRKFIDLFSHNAKIRPRNILVRLGSKVACANAIVNSV